MSIGVSSFFNEYISHLPKEIPKRMVQSFLLRGTISIILGGTFMGAAIFGAYGATAMLIESFTRPIFSLFGEPRTMGSEKDFDNLRMFHLSCSVAGGFELVNKVSSIFGGTLKNTIELYGGSTWKMTALYFWGAFLMNFPFDSKKAYAF